MNISKGKKKGGGGPTLSLGWINPAQTVVDSTVKDIRVDPIVMRNSELHTAASMVLFWRSAARRRWPNGGKFWQTGQKNQVGNFDLRKAGKKNENFWHKAKSFLIFHTLFIFRARMHKACKCRAQKGHNRRRQSVVSSTKEKTRL